MINLSILSPHSSVSGSENRIMRPLSPTIVGGSSRDQLSLMPTSPNSNKLYSYEAQPRNGHDFDLLSTADDMDGEFGEWSHSVVPNPISLPPLSKPISFSTKSIESKSIDKPPFSSSQIIHAHEYSFVSTTESVIKEKIRKHQPLTSKSVTSLHTKSSFDALKEDSYYTGGINKSLTTVSLSLDGISPLPSTAAVEAHVGVQSSSMRPFYSKGLSRNVKVNMQPRVVVIPVNRRPVSPIELLDQQPQLIPTQSQPLSQPPPPRSSVTTPQRVLSAGPQQKHQSQSSQHQQAQQPKMKVVITSPRPKRSREAQSAPTNITPHEFDDEFVPSHRDLDGEDYEAEPSLLDVSDAPYASTVNTSSQQQRKPNKQNVIEFKKGHVKDSKAKRHPSPQKIAYVLAPLNNNQPPDNNHQRDDDSISHFTTVSTVGNKYVKNGIAPFKVHRRMLGWKLTSVSRRRDLVDMLDLLHGQVPQGQRKSNKGLQNKVKQLQSAPLLLPFENVNEVNNKALSSLLPSVNDQRAQQKSRARSTEAWEKFVERGTRRRCGYDSVQQIKELMEDRKKEQTRREKIIANAASNQHQIYRFHPLLASQEQQQMIPVIEAGNVVKTAIGSRYVPVGVLSSADRVGKAPLDGPLINLLRSELTTADGDDGMMTLDQYDFTSDADNLRNKLQRPLSPAQQLYNFPVNVHKTRDRQDILSSVKIRSQLEGQLSREASRNEDRMVEAFIAGRQHARLRRGGSGSRDDSVADNDFFPLQSRGTMGDLLSEAFEELSALSADHSLSTNAEENQRGLSEALMENFGVSLDDDDDDDEVDKILDDEDDRVSNSSTIESRSTTGTNANHLVTAPQMIPRNPSIVSLTTTSRKDSGIDSKKSATTSKKSKSSKKNILIKQW